MTRQINLAKSHSNWSRRVKLRRGLWEFVYLFFWPKHFRFLSPIRVFILRAFGARMSSRVLIMGGVRVWMPWNLELGDYSTIGEGCEIYNFSKVVIGNNTVVSQRCFICTASHDYAKSDMPLVWEDINIGDFVWIAAESFVAPGVTIGQGAVIAARSVVTRNIEDWSVQGGNPAKFIKKREVSE